MSGHTARELAAMRLPGLGSFRRIQIRAQREGWPYTERARGGDGRSIERMYPTAALPIAAQAALARLSATRQPTTDAADAPERHREMATERAHLVRAVERLIANGTSGRAACAAVSRGTEHSARSVQRFYARTRGASETDWLALLLPQWVGGGAAVDCHLEAWEFLKSDYLRGSAPGFAACYRRMRAVATARGWSPIPSKRTLQRRFEREVPRTAVVLYRKGPDALERMYPAQERDRSGLEVMQAWNGDGHRADVSVRWPDGVIERPVVLGFQDVASNKIVGYRVDRTENTDLVRLAFADASDRYGAPTSIYLDNGRAFASKQLTGGIPNRFRFKVRPEDPEGILKQLGMKVHWTKPYHGQSKPIERAWRDFVEDVSRHPAFEGAYLGSDPTRKPHNSGTRVIELAEFIRVLDAQIKEENAREGRRAGVTPNGESFDQIFAAGYERAQPAKLTVSQRRLLYLAVDGLRVRNATAELHFYGNRFWANELIPLQGQRVTVRFDPDNIQRGIDVYRLDGEFVCSAELQQAGGFNSVTASRDYNRKRSAWVRAQKQAAQAERALEASELAELHLAAQGAPDPLPVPASKVVRGAFNLPREPRAEDKARLAKQDEFLRQVGASARAKLMRRAAGGSE